MFPSTVSTYNVGHEITGIKQYEIWSGEITSIWRWGWQNFEKITGEAIAAQSFNPCRMMHDVSPQASLAGSEQPCRLQDEKYPFFTLLILSQIYAIQYLEKHPPCLSNLAWTSTSNLDQTFCSKSEQKFCFMTKSQLPNLQQTGSNTILIINISNSNNLNKFLVGIAKRQGHINQVY